MKTYRGIEGIYSSMPISLGGKIIQQAIPLPSLSQVSPFILLHHFDIQLEAGDDSFYVPPHPHRGFSPITFMFRGSVEHKDSLGNHEVIEDFEVQWINAARGIMHSEKASPKMIQQGGRYQGVQLWINLASEDKMKTPEYFPIRKSQIPTIEADGVLFRLISGKYNDKIGAAPSKAITAMLSMKAGSEFALSLPEQNSLLYVLEGTIQLNDDSNISKNKLIVFKQENGSIKIKASQDSELLVLSGEDLHEPVVAHGPFVMNTQTEILEAMRDFGKGKMGYLTD